MTAHDHKDLISPREFELMTQAQFAHVAGQSEVTVARWRRQGDGPAYLKLGRRVAYKRVDVETWLDSRRVTSTADHKARTAGRVAL